MEKLINYILQYVQLDQNQIDFLTTNAKELYLKKGDFFLKEGKTAKEVGFILNGVVRVFHLDKDANDTSLAFLEENRLVVDLASFNTQTPSSVYIQAVTNCELLVLNGELFDQTNSLKIPWDLFFNKIMTESFFNKERKGRIALTGDATTRYLNFLKNYPNLANRIPLSNLASYLGITQSSLSRIRKNIS